MDRHGDARVTFETAFDTAGIDLGASVACSGVCLTVVDKGPGGDGGPGWFACDVSAETLARSTASDWQAGTPVNLERSLKLGDELGGHLVYGHVDGVGTVQARAADGEAYRLTFNAPPELMRLIAVKGSIAVDGVSLTVNRVGAGDFEVTVIPHTLRVTTLGASQPGTRVNLEIDMLARYVQRLLAKD